MINQIYDSLVEALVNNLLSNTENLSAELTDELTNLTLSLSSRDFSRAQETIKALIALCENQNRPAISFFANGLSSLFMVNSVQMEGWHSSIRLYREACRSATSRDGFILSESLLSLIRLQSSRPSQSKERESYLPQAADLSNELIERLRRTTSNRARLFQAEASVAFLNQNFFMAENNLLKSLTVNKNPNYEVELKLDLANIYIAKREFSKAVALLENAIQIEDHNWNDFLRHARLHHTLGRALHNLRGADASFEVFRKAFDYYRLDTGTSTTYAYDQLDVLNWMQSWISMPSTEREFITVSRRNLHTTVKQ